MLKHFPRNSDPVDVCVLEGRKAILAQVRILESFSARCGQTGAMGWLPFFLDAQTARWKRPYLGMVLRAGASMAAIQAEDLVGAALYFEYRLGPLRSGAFSTDDMSGFRAVVAPAELRASVAAMLNEAMVKHGAHMVLTSFETDAAASPAPNAREDEALMHRDLPPALVAARTRTLGKYLRLQPTFAATMSTLGKRTRTHMRYYQRRLVKKSGCSFVADACRVLSMEDFMRANATSLNPVSKAACKLRYRNSSAQEGGFLCGLRAANGQWLSLTGGWRQGGTTVLQWQINAKGFERDSLRTVMRTFLLEAEVARGTERLLFYGGTSHSMRHSFVQEAVCDVVVRRKSLQARALLLLARLVAGEHSVTGRTNFLAEALHSPSLVWVDAPGRSEYAATAPVVVAAPKLPLRQIR